KLASRYAFEFLGAERITIVVIDNNLSALNCYKSAGFSETPGAKRERFGFFNEEWTAIELELLK
ncbi:MAG: N-acetyltransferase, partial [Lachnospiraceae bacterium]|nr:N-acetyltransferase [Lachnospiraceae bacterium]